MKVLLLTDIPPCDDFTAGLVLAAMVRFLPPGSVCCFAVVNPTLPLRISPEFSSIPTEFHRKPNENWAWLPQRRLLRKATAFASLVGEKATLELQVKPLIDQAIAFGKAHDVDRVWAVLQGQTIIRMAQPVADGLNVPLHTHVWDPFSWWAKANRLDGRTTTQVQLQFDRAIAASAGVATASQPMADIYKQRFGVPAVPVIASHSEKLARTPPPETTPNDVLWIGMAGQFYSADEWGCLVTALRAANWHVASRPVRLVVMGPQTPPHMDDGKIFFLGWKSQHDAAEILSSCDLLYCPYPFDPSMKDVSRFSFPSKLVLYLAAGRPIIFHGPNFSSPAHYIRDRNCGLVAERLLPTAIFNEIERLVIDQQLYHHTALGAQSAFRTDFTLASMKRAFAEFIGMEVASQDPLIHRHAAEGQPYPDRLPDVVRHRALAVVALSVARKVRDTALAAKRRARRAATVVALKIPRLYSLHHEIHNLYSELATLRSQVALLQAELSRLEIAPDGLLETIDAPEGILRETSVFSTAVDPFLSYSGSRSVLIGQSKHLVLLPGVCGANNSARVEHGGSDIHAFTLNLYDGCYVVTPLKRLPTQQAGGAKADAFAAEKEQAVTRSMVRMALEARADEIIAACSRISDLEASVAMRTGQLLGLPVTLALEFPDHEALEAMPHVTIRLLTTGASSLEEIIPA